MIRKIFTHLSIIFSLIMLILYIINKINPAMGFLKGNVFEAFFLIYIIVTLIFAVSLIEVKRLPKHKN